VDNSSLKKFLVDHGWLEQERPNEMLFDLYLDPLEQNNLAKDQSYKKIKNELSSELEEWMEATKDPLASKK